MLPLLFLVGAVVAGVGVAASFWNDIKEWIIRAADLVQKTVKGIVLGVKVFAKKMGEAFQEISKHYSKKNGNWEETTVTRTIDVSEVPEEFRNLAEENETDITSKLQLELA